VPSLREPVERISSLTSMLSFIVELAGPPSTEIPFDKGDEIVCVFDGRCLQAFNPLPQNSFVPIQLDQTVPGETRRPPYCTTPHGLTSNFRPRASEYGEREFGRLVNYQRRLRRIRLALRGEQNQEKRRVYSEFNR